MERKIDPNNLSGGDVFRILVPLVAYLVALVVAAQFGAKYFWIVVVLGVVFVLYSVHSLPKESAQAIAEAEQRTNDKIKKLPVVGSVIYPLWRVIGWASTLVSIATIMFLIYLVYNGLSK